MNATTVPMVIVVDPVLLRWHHNTSLRYSVDA